MFFRKRKNLDSRTLFEIRQGSKILNYDVIKIPKSPQKQDFFGFLKVIFKTVITDGASALRFVLPKSIIKVRIIKFIFLFCLFALPLAGVISIGHGGKYGGYNNNGGKAVPQPNPQPQSNDQAFFVSFSSSFDFLQPVVATYPVTSSNGHGGTSFTSKTTNIIKPEFIYIALNASQRIVFKIATGSTNQYIFQMTGSQISQQEKAAGQSFVGFNIYQDLNAIVRPNYNNNTNDDIYSIYASTTTDKMFQKFVCYHRPVPFKNLPPRFEMDFAIPEHGGFPSGSSLNFSYVHGSDNVVYQDSVVAYKGETSDEIWLAADTLNLPIAPKDSDNVYRISDEDVAENQPQYIFGIKQHANPNNYYYNFKLVTQFKDSHDSDVFIQFDFHYKTNFIYAMMIKKIERDNDNSGYFYDLTFTLNLTNKKAVWI